MNDRKRIKEIQEDLRRSNQQTYSHISKDIDDIIRDFENQTQLNLKDFGFMLLITALHLSRQYIINNITERKDHDITDKVPHKLQEKTKKGYEIVFGANCINDDFSKRFYYASRNEIFNSLSVPYDVTNGSKPFELGGKNKGISGLTHRHYTLGHDPILGLYFGTANILTNTLTTTKLKTVHVANGCIVCNAQTHLMIEKFHQRITDEPIDVSFALIKQVLHIWSDTYSKKGIELPLIARNLDYSSAKKLTEYGIDYGNAKKIGSHFVAAELINYFSRLILCLLYNVNEENHIIIEPKVHKIITGANILASSSNILEAAITKSLSNVDFGGFLATIHQICSSKKRIIELQREFLNNEWAKKL